MGLPVPVAEHRRGLFVCAGDWEPSVIPSW
nr:MAG TPA: hypothetical protein [Caudoviricetes sp.]